MTTGRTGSLGEDGEAKSNKTKSINWFTKWDKKVPVQGVSSALQPNRAVIAAIVKGH